MSTQTKKTFYQFFYLIISIVFIIIFVKQFGKLATLAEAFSKISWYFIFAILTIQGLAIINRGAFYQSLYGFFKVRDPLKKFIMLSLTSNFMNLAAPAGGFSGMAVFISEAESHGMSKSRATLVNLFAYFLIYSVFVLVLMFGLFYLLFNHQLYQYQLITAGVLFGGLTVFVIIFVAAVEGAARVKKLFNFVAGIINFFARIFQKKHLISDEDVHVISLEINRSLKYIQNNYRSLTLPIFHVILMEIIDILTLYYLFLAFGYAIHVGTLLTVYAIGILFTLVSLTPGGIGFVEAAMIFVLSNLRVPVELSAIVVLAYRLFTFWIQFLLGYLGFRTFQKKKLDDLDNGTS